MSLNLNNQHAEEDDRKDALHLTPDFMSQIWNPDICQGCTDNTLHWHPVTLSPVQYTQITSVGGFLDQVPDINIIVRPPNTPHGHWHIDSSFPGAKTVLFPFQKPATREKNPNQRCTMSRRVACWCSPHD